MKWNIEEAGEAVELLPELIPLERRCMFAGTERQNREEDQGTRRETRPERPPKYQRGAGPAVLPEGSRAAHRGDLGQQSRRRGTKLNAEGSPA